MQLNKIPLYRNIYVRGARPCARRHAISLHGPRGCEGEGAREESRVRNINGYKSTRRAKFRASLNNGVLVKAADIVLDQRQINIAISNAQEGVAGHRTQADNFHLSSLAADGIGGVR